MEAAGAPADGRVPVESQSPRAHHLPVLLALAQGASSERVTSWCAEVVRAGVRSTHDPKHNTTKLGVGGHRNSEPTRTLVVVTIC